MICIATLSEYLMFHNERTYCAGILEKYESFRCQRLNDSQTLSSIHVVILFMWRFTSGIVALKKTSALCVAFSFVFLFLGCDTGIGHSGVQI